MTVARMKSGELCSRILLHSIRATVLIHCQMISDIERSVAESRCGSREVDRMLSTRERVEHDPVSVRNRSLPNAWLISSLSHEKRALQDIERLGIRLLTNDLIGPDTRLTV
jgi:hypothetical protein